MIVLNRSLLNREYILINVLKALTSIISTRFVQSPCNFLIEDYTEIFYTIYKLNVSSVQSKMEFRRSTTARKVDPLSLFFINFNIPTLTPGLHWAETTLDFSDNKTLLSIRPIQSGVVGKEG
jgi:hypothetical protein